MKMLGSYTEAIDILLKILKSTLQRYTLAKVNKNTEEASSAKSEIRALTAAIRELKRVRDEERIKFEEWWENEGKEGAPRADGEAGEAGDTNGIDGDPY